MLNREELLDYIQMAKQGDENAKQILFENNAPLIKSIIKRFKNKGVEYEDLYQIGCIGFVKAIKNFDMSFGVQFSTYTVPMVIGEIKRYMRDNGAIKVSRSLKVLANKINHFVDEYLSIYGTNPSIEIISEKFSISQEEVVLAMESSRLPLSIHDKFEEDDEGQELLEKIPCVNNEDINIDKLHLYSIIENLPEREQKLIVMRYFRDKTQSEVANCLGVSQVQVSRLESKILLKLKSKA